MGAGRKGGEGVEITKWDNIRITFHWEGQRCRETLGRRPTPPNLKYAAKLVAEINNRIGNGTFNYAEYFPDSPRAKGTAKQALKVREVGELWFQSKGRLSGNAKSQYRNALNFWYKQPIGKGILLGDMQVKSVNHVELAALVGGYNWSSWQLCNNYLIVLRGLFLLAMRGQYRSDNPMNGIENMAKESKLPDPLSADEAEKILAYMAKRYHEQVFNYFEFAFQTGMRPEEIIALRWTDIDWPRKTIRVQRARSFRGQTKAVKTGESRDVDLAPRALAALERQKQFTFMLRDADIFHNPVTNKPWHDERSQREHYWNPCLKHLGIRHRRAYATRHTVATRLLMAGIKPGYIAYQLGHTTAVLFSTYARWLNEADKGQEAAKLAEALGGTALVLPSFGVKKA